MIVIMQDSHLVYPIVIAPVPAGGDLQEVDMELFSDADE